MGDNPVHGVEVRDQAALGEEEYLDRVYRRFVQRRRHGLVLSVREWEQIVDWRELGIPLSLVLRVMDWHLESADGRARAEPISKIARRVKLAWKEWRKSQIGQEEGSAEEVEGYSKSFVLGQILPPALDSFMGSLPEDKVGHAARKAVLKAIARLRRRRGRTLSMEQLLRWEAKTNKELVDEVAKVAPKEMVEAAQARARQIAESRSGRAAGVLGRKLFQLGLRRKLGLQPWSMTVLIPSGEGGEDE